MIALARLRKHLKETISKSLSDQGQATTWLAQAQAAFSTHEIMLRPTIYTSPIQVLNPADPDFGKPYFLPDYDPPDNPDGLPLR